MSKRKPNTCEARGYACCDAYSDIEHQWRFGYVSSNSITAHEETLETRAADVLSKGLMIVAAVMGAVVVTIQVLRWYGWEM